MKKKGLIPQNTVPGVSRVNIYSSLLGRNFFCGRLLKPIFSSNSCVPKQYNDLLVCYVVKGFKGSKVYKGSPRKPPLRVC